jgi:small multidrug resistance pump
MAAVLWAAAIYNVLWGSFVVLFPSLPFSWVGMPAPNYPEIWQCVGMIVGVYGVGYAIAATDPIRHRALVFVGLLGKILGPLGFLHAAWQGRLPWKAGWTIITNDLIWWLPFAAILLASIRARATSQTPDERR